MMQQTSALGLKEEKIMNTETALITGSSSGIGLHLAHEFARHGHPLVLVAPVLSELESVAADIQSKHNVPVEVVQRIWRTTRRRRKSLPNSAAVTRGSTSS